jgi:hypothetical protein
MAPKSRPFCQLIVSVQNKLFNQVEDFNSARTITRPVQLMGLVTIFAETLPSFIVTEMLSDILKDFLAAVVSHDRKIDLITCTMTGKNCAIASLHRETFLTKVPGH